MKTIYAKTLNPEDFDYRVYEYCLTEDENIIVDGGRQFQSYNNDILETIDELYNDYDSWDYERCLKTYYYNSIMMYIKSMLHIQKLTTKQAHTIKVALKEGWSKEELYLICLETIRGEPYEKHTLRGYCQGDVVTMYCPKSYGKDVVDYIEAVYFATGTEVMIHDEESEPDSANDISGYTFYTANWKTEDIKKEVLDQIHQCQGEEYEIKLWLYKDSYRIRHDNYELAGE